MAIASYEAIYILPPRFEDAQVEEVVEKFKSVVSDQGGQVESAGKWEKRKLAYEIAGEREGIYCTMQFSSEGELPKELYRLFRISDDVMRARIYRREA